MKKIKRIIPFVLITAAVSCTQVTQSNTGRLTPNKTTPITSLITQPMQSTVGTFTQAVPEVPEIIVELVDQADLIGKLDQNGLYEIQDQVLIEKISAMLPESDKYLKESRRQKGDIFKAVIPLALSPDTATEIGDVINGLLRDPSVIRNYAERFKSDYSKILDPVSYFTKILKIYDVAQFIGDQVALYEINNNIEILNGKVEKIDTFQEQEFSSKIKTFHSEVKNMSHFSNEILTNDELRKRKLDQLEGLKTNVNQLLNQVNGTMTTNISKTKIDFTDYAKLVQKEEELSDYQNILTSILGEISNLTMVFSNGTVSKELSFSIYNQAILDSNYARAALSEWHDQKVDDLGIDLENKRVSKEGFDGIIAAIPGVFNKDWTKKELSDEFIQSISNQRKTPAFVPQKPWQLSGNQVTIIILNGRYYYLADQKG